ncbi:hypothetical protein JB92DRAFT_3160796, partial [Gautieria morchelliformis]
MSISSMFIGGTILLAWRRGCMHSTTSAEPGRYFTLASLTRQPGSCPRRINNRDHTLTPFIVYQGLWNVIIRDFECDIVPMYIDERLPIAHRGPANRAGSRVRLRLSSTNGTTRTSARTPPK